MARHDTVSTHLIWSNRLTTCSLNELGGKVSDKLALPISIPVNKLNTSSTLLTV